MINLILKTMENEALKTVFLKLANMSISASWLVLVILLLRVILKKAPKWINVLLWGIVAVRLICPFSFESVLSLIPNAETIPMNIEMDATPAFDSGINAVNSVVNPIISASFTPHPGASANPLQIWIPLAAVIWFFGMVLMMLYTAISYWRLCRKIDTAVLYKDNIFQSENVGSSFVLGILKPRIYLPYSVDGKNLEHVVAHEQAHISRKDHWWKPLGFLLLTVYWFNPLMWVAYILLCRDIELACDEKVISDLGSEQRADYTQALVACSVNRKMVEACPLAFGEVGVKERVKSVMNYKKPAFWIVALAVITCLLVALCFLTNPSENKDGFNIVEESDEIIGIISAGEITDQYVTQNGDILLIKNDGDLWQFEEGRQVNVAISIVNDGSYLSMKSVGYIYCGDGSDWIYAKEIFSDQTVSPSSGSFIVPESGNYLFYFRNYSASWLKLNSVTIEYGSSLHAKIIEIHEGYYLVEPIDGSWVLNSTEQIEVPMMQLDPYLEPQVGDVIEISCSGEILETYPARLSQVYSISIVEEAESWDLIPMVMVEGVLYLDTGKESTAMARCGMMDGEITSEVSGNEEPSMDDQSNFGTGYGYQYGAIEGTIEIFMNEKWWIFATEEARKEMQFPLQGTDMELMIDPIVPVTVVDQITGEMTFVNSNPSIRAIQSLIASEWWAEGNPACDYDFKITVNDESYWYHSDCGMFTDVLGERCITLDENQKEAIDKLLSEAQNDVLDRYWLTIGADGVKRVEILTPNTNGGYENADRTLFKKGERIWAECLDGHLDLRGVSFTAFGEDGQIIWKASIPDSEDNEGFTHLRNNDWSITNIP